VEAFVREAFFTGGCRNRIGGFLSRIVSNISSA
jgi:hypothetical protein